MIGHDELMRYLDGELPPERARAVEEELARSSELRRDYVLFREMKRDLRDMGGAMRSDGGVWAAVSRRLTQPLGWILFLLGALVWVAYGAYTYLTGADALWEKLATGAVVIGLALLLASAVIDRLRTWRTDPYREIQR